MRCVHHCLGSLISPRECCRQLSEVEIQSDGEKKERYGVPSRLCNHVCERAFGNWVTTRRVFVFRHHSRCLHLKEKYQSSGKKVRRPVSREKRRKVREEKTDTETDTFCTQGLEQGSEQDSEESSEKPSVSLYFPFCFLSNDRYLWSL